MKKILIILAILLGTGTTVQAAFTVDEGSQQKAVAPLLNLIKTTQWDLFFTEFEMWADFGECNTKNLAKRSFGFKARLIEPIGYFESSRRRYDFVFAGFKIDEGDTSTEDTGTDWGDKSVLENIIRFGPTRDGGGGAGRGNFIWSHFIYAPIFGMIFKKKLKFACFGNGDIAFPILTELFPPYSKDIMYINMIAPMAIMFSPQGLVSGILDCGSTMAVNTMHGFQSGSSGSVENNGALNEFIEDTNQYDPNVQDAKANKNPSSGFLDSTEEFLNSIRNTMYWNVGCLGFAPVGGYVPGDDPGTDNEIVGYAMMNLMHGASSILPKALLEKQTNFLMAGMPKSGTYSTTGTTGNLNALDSMCHPVEYAMMIESQYLFQRAGTPTTGDAHCVGVSGAVTTAAANTPDSADSWVHLVWRYRDYLAFAYQCPK